MPGLFANASNQPEWVQEQIAKYENSPKGNPAYTIYQFEYKNKMVFYLPAQCCDLFSEVYDMNKTYICSPDGGLAGMGDGQCIDFFDVAKNKKLIWKDNR